MPGATHPAAQKRREDIDARSRASEVRCMRAIARVPILTKVNYGIGAIAYGIKDNGFSVFLLLYYNQVVGLPAGAVGSVIAIALVFDALIDPVIGALSALMLLAPWLQGDIKITTLTLGGFVVCLGVLMLCARGLLRVLQYAPALKHKWRVSVANLVRRPGLAVLQLTALGLSVMAITLLAVVRTDLVTSWAATIPADAPDHFLINIQSEQIPAIEDFLHPYKVGSLDFYAMARGRLVAINGKTITPDDFADERAKRLADREFNLSPATIVKADNRIVKGQFWEASATTSQFSFDADVAHALHLDVGDEITFTVAEQQIKGKITSLRDINWETMQANFYVVAPPTALAGVPGTFITSFKLPPNADSLLRDLNQNFPSITVVDVMAILRQIRAVMDKALAAIQFVFMFTLAAGLLVVIAAIRATQTERLRTAAIMKTLGATRQHVLQLTAGEFAILGTLAGSIGTFAANIAAWLIATQAIHIKFIFNLPLVLGAIAATVLTVLATASYLIVKIWRQPVADVLREWY